jgi:hypothetical protein
MVEEFSLVYSKFENGFRDWIPNNREKRARALNGNSEECPYNTIELKIIMEVERGLADLHIENETGDFCWNRCHIEDCPRYIENKK